MFAHRGGYFSFLTEEYAKKLAGFVFVFGFFTEGEGLENELEHPKDLWLIQTNCPLYTQSRSQLTQGRLIGTPGKQRHQVDIATVTCCTVVSQ